MSCQKRVILIFAALAVSATMLAAADLPRKETLIVDIFTGKAGSPGNFNMWAGWVNNDKGLHQLISDPLWMCDYVTGKIIDTLAAAPAEYSKDYKKMTVKLRKGVTWSDGVAFTADDVVYTVEAMKATKGMSYNAEFNLYVDKVYKTDDSTVVFELTKPNTRFHEYFIDRWGACRIVPKHVWEKQSDLMSFEYNPPVGTGPYVLKDYDKAGYWYIYERRADWAKSPTGILYGKPAPRYVQFIYYGLVEKKIIAQSQHQLDMCELTPESVGVAKMKNTYSRSYSVDFPWYEILHPCVSGATFQTDKYPYSERDVRWALNLSLDVVDMAMTAYDGATAFCPGYVPSTLPFFKWYYEPMQSWFESYTFKVNGQTYKPYDSQIPFKLAAAAKKRGYTVPSESNDVHKMFGYGWWKFDPVTAEKLLLAKGFSRDKNKMWQLPDGTPWKMTITSSTNPANAPFHWAFGMANQWKNFGIDATVDTTENVGTISDQGTFDVNTDQWPIREPFGSSPDIYRSIQGFNSKFYVPVGQPLAGGHSGRWHDPELDKIINAMAALPANDPKIIPLGMDAMKIMVNSQPGVSLGAYVDAIGWDTYYWTNYPGRENPYMVPHYHWPNLKFMLPFLKATGRN